ncbi:MAG: ABC transporter ATP-binding protein [Candidatus Dojkabacteria bacterium]
MESTQLTLKQNFSIAIWLTRLALSFNKITYLLFITTTIIQDNLSIATTFLAALLIQKLTDGAESFNSDIILILILVFINGFFSSYIYDLTRYLHSRITQNWEIKIWEIFLNKTAKLDFQYLESPDYNILIGKVKEVVDWRALNVALTVPELLSGLVGIILTAGIFFTLNPIFMVLILIPEIFRFFVNKKYGYALFNLWDSHGPAKIHARYAQHSLEQDDVLREAKIYSFTSTILSRYTTEIRKFMDESIRKLNERYALIGLSTFFDVTISISIQVWLITQVFAKSVTIGSYIFYITNINTASAAFNRIQVSISYLFEQIPFVGELKKYLALKDLVPKPVNPVMVNQATPKIEFRNVSFSYPATDRKAVDNVSFIVNPGEKVALVGENGSGKTTIIKLLARFYDVTDGEILINDVNIKDVDLATYYKLWGVLFQSFAKLWFSIRENIGVGNVEDINNIELIKEAARKADAKKFIEKYPKKYETLLSKDFEGGVQLSGGQWQKLGIARAMFANPKLIVLDEPTSALDSLAETEVFENINELSKDSTVFVISHRFATVRNANRILVLKEGKLLEQGTHEELLKNESLYATMFNEQAKGYK